MGVNFDSSKGIIIDDVDIVREEVRGFWSSALNEPNKPPLDVTPSTPQGQLIDSQTAAIMDKDSEILYLANQLNPETAEGVFQDALGKMYFLDRKVAEPTLVTCLCTGLAGTVIPKNSFVKTVSGLLLQSVNDGVIFSNGVAEIIFETQEKGSIEVAANTVTKIVTVIPGWDTVNNPAAGVIGRVEESRSAFEARRLASVAVNAHGSAKALYGALANIPDVAALALLENSTPQTVSKWGVDIPSHSFFISIYGGDDTMIAKTIYEKKDAGAGTTGNTEVTYIDVAFAAALYKFNIFRPTPTPFAVKVVLRKSSLTPDNIAVLVKDAVIKNFNGLDDSALTRVSMATVVYASRFYPSIMAILGKTLLSIEIAYPYDSASPVWGDEVTVNAASVPVLDYDDVVVEVLE